MAQAAQTLAGQIRPYVADATRGMPLRAMLEEISAEQGQINVLVNNPRIMPETSLLEMDEWDWQRTLEMNLNGPFLITKLIAGQMRELGQGTILNLVDTNPPALTAPGRSAYAASQAGFMAFSQAAARELIAYNIRVFTLCPEFEVLYPTNLIEMTRPAAGIPLLQSEALTQLAVFLSGPAASHLPGQMFRVGRQRFTPQPAQQQEPG